MAPGTAAPIRDPSRNNFKSPLKKAARRIVTAPTFNVIRTIDFDKKTEYEKFIKFIESSNKELAKIKLEKPEINKALTAVLPLFAPDPVKVNSLKLSWFKRIADNWKRFVKKFKKSEFGKKLRNLLARWKKVERGIRNLLKRIKNIKWFKLEGLGKRIKELKEWIKSPKKFPKWPKDLLKGFKDAFDKLKNVNVKEILNRLKWVRAITNVVLGKATPWGLAATTIINDIVNTGTSKYPDMQGPNAYFNAPSLQKHGVFKVQDVYGQILLTEGRDIANNLEALKAKGMEADLLARYAKFLENKNRVQKAHSSEYSNLNTKKSIETELAEIKEQILDISSEQLQINYNPKAFHNAGRLWKRNADKLEELLDKSSYLELKKREFYNELKEEQSNIKSNNNFDLSKIYSMDSSVLPSLLSYGESLNNSTILNNGPQLFVMPSDSESQLIPFPISGSSNISIGDGYDMSKFNGQILDELRFIKLSGG